MYYSKYWDASLPLRVPPNVKRQNGWNAFMSRQYRNAYNWFEIERQLAIGQNEYENINIRLTSVTDPGTGLALSDDWLALIFNVDENPIMGQKYRYKNSIWLTVNIQKYSSPTKNCVIHRCNNYLTFINKQNVIYKEPCVIDPALKFGSVYYNNSVDVPQGAIAIWLQMNDITKDISINDRFLIGYNQAYKVKSVINYLSDTTFDEKGSPLIRVEATLDTIQSTDDFDDRLNGGMPVIDNTAQQEEYTEILPENHTVLQGQTTEFSCFRFVDGNVTTDTFTFTIINDVVPTSRYEFTVVDDNHFTIKNIKKYLTAPIVIECKNNITEEKINIDIMLGGAY